MSSATGTSRHSPQITTHRLLLTVIAAVLAAAAVGAGAAAAAKTPQTTLTLYSVTKKQSFINNEDDRVRGVGNSPFNADATAAASSSTQEGRNGPFAGDNSIAVNALYSDDALQHTVGVASIWCDYVFDKNSLCKATIQLKDGILTAFGPVVFGRRQFTLAITGGTGKYRGQLGELRVIPATGAISQIAQRFTIVLG